MSSFISLRFISTLLIVLFGVAAAHAQQAGDKATIAKCLETASTGANFGGQCIGVVADPCIKKAAGSQTDVKDWKACAARELAVWNGVLGEALKQVKAGGFADITKSVAASQTAWTQSLKTLCPVFDKIEPGVGAEGGSEYCSLQETARRALLLKRIGESVGEH